MAELRNTRAFRLITLHLAGSLWIWAQRARLWLWGFFGSKSLHMNRVSQTHKSLAPCVHLWRYNSPSVCVCEFHIGYGAQNNSQVLATNYDIVFVLFGCITFFSVCKLVVFYGKRNTTTCYANIHSRNDRSSGVGSLYMLVEEKSSSKTIDLWIMH